MDRESRLPELIEGEGLTLRRWRVTDAKLLAAAVTESMEHLRPWMGWTVQEPLTLGQREEMLTERERAWLHGGDVMLGIFLADRVVGSCGLHRRIGPRGLELGYWVHPAFTRRGVATKAARMLTGAAFSLPGIECVEIHHDRANEASAGTAAKLGFDLVEERAEGAEAPAEVGVECVWRMRREAWQHREKPADASGNP